MNSTYASEGKTNRIAQGKNLFSLFGGEWLRWGSNSRLFTLLRLSLLMSSSSQPPTTIKSNSPCDYGYHSRQLRLLVWMDIPFSIQQLVTSLIQTITLSPRSGNTILLALRYHQHPTPIAIVFVASSLAWLFARSVENVHYTYNVGVV